MCPELEACLKAHGCKTLYSVACLTKSTAIGGRDLLRKMFTVGWGEEAVMIVAAIRAVEDQAHPGMK
jgi:hypothetical protein